MDRRPLPDSEYRERRERVAAAMAAAGLDALAVTADKHKLYLGGVASSTHWPAPLIIVPGARPVALGRLYDIDAYEQAVRDCDVEAFFGDDAIDVWASVMRRLGVASGRVGLELDAPGLSPAQVRRFGALLPEVDIVDATRLTADLEMIKSHREIAVMRDVAEINRKGHTAFLDGISSGLSDLELQHAMLQALVAAGSHRPHVESTQGVRTAVPHAGYDPSAASRIAPGLPAHTEFSATLYGYSAGQVRSAIMGRSREVEDLFALATEVLETIETTLRPGARSCDVDQAARSVVEDAGRTSTYRHRVGYTIGLLWGEAPVSIDLSPDNESVIQEGMCFHTPVNLFEKGRFGVGISETWEVTATGCRPITVLPRELIRLD